MDKTKAELSRLKRGSKQWWAKWIQVANMQLRISNIPALKVDGAWLNDSTDKANAFAKTFNGKYVLAKEEANEYSHLCVASSVQAMPELPPLAQASKILSSLEAQAATGPDLLPTVVLKTCAR